MAHRRRGLLVALKTFELPQKYYTMCDQVLNSQKLISTYIRAIVDKYNTNTLAFHGEVLCAVCEGLIEEDEPAEFIICRYRFVVDTYTHWARELTHIKCVREPPPSTKEMFIAKRERSVQILLLLQEIGLPWDIAWPIAAVSCWLL